jgi:sterol desaturase/sphingolipid hydroxylase (fatty acid hydroxylase superfamily)
VALPCRAPRLDILLHANLPWTFGPLRNALASPAFHRWHHTWEAEGMDRNFSGLFPWIDLLFGTFYPTFSF